MSEQRTEKAIQVHNTLSQLTVTYGLMIQDVVEELNQARAKVKELTTNYKAQEEEYRKAKVALNDAFISGWKAAVTADREDTPENTPELALAKWIASERA